MSSSHHRPVYIPKNRRRGKTFNNNGNTSPSSDRPSTSAAGRKRPPPQQQPRFHGAFTGGFSAGHFNTVATKDGWTPSTAKKTDQKLEDFMDEEDHAEWGGPTKIREDFAGLVGDRRSSQTNIQAAQSPKPISNKSSLLQPSSVPDLSGLASVLEIKHETVGPRLLRRLGWREGETALVPEETSESHPATTTNGDNDDDDENALSRIHLSKKRVRRLQLQTNRTKVPPPKLDQCGLGFEPYQDAPEFQRYRERRKQHAQDRATYNQRDNVYRISDVAGGEEDDDGNNINGKALSRSEDNSNDQHGRNEYLSYETAEDFVGKRSSAGFALRDDEDDAYDNQQSHGGDRTQKVTSKHLGDDYNMEVYEHESSDEDGAFSSNKSINISKSQSPSAKPSSTNLFAAWAGGGDKKSTTKQSNPNKVAPQPAMTSSGRPPVPGFALGISSEGSRKRYPGPDIPRDFEVQRHEFGENEHPEVFQTISRAMKLQQEEEAATAAIQNQRRFLLQRQQSKSMSSNFTSLADAMKSRFTSSTPSSQTATSTQEQGQQHPAGLYLPDPIKQSRDQDDTPTSKPSVTITRTVHSFFPIPLVCKRFRVSAPSHVSASGGPVVSADARQTEATYFEQEILSSANAHAKGNKNEDSIGSIVKATPVQEGEDDEQTEVPKGIARPSLEKLKSIFEASSDVSGSDGEEEEEVEEEKLKLHDKSEQIMGKKGDTTAFGLEAPAETIDITVTQTNHHALVEYQSRTVATTKSESNSEISEDESTQSSHHRRKKSRKKEKKKKRKRSRRSRSPTSSDGDGIRRKTKKEKKRRK